MDALHHYITDDPHALSFAAATLVAGCLVLKCLLPPNANSKNEWKGDSFQSTAGMNFVGPVAAAITTTFVYHALVAVASPTALPLVCPKRVANPALFAWNSYTATILVVILLFAPIRLGAYKHLGKNFTYSLAAPNRLVTDGVYAYVQHPSYTGFLFVIGSCMALFCRWDAGASCYMPDFAARLIDAMPFSALVTASAAVAGLAKIVRVRVSQEEAMLKELFGDEWVNWNARTARFIPGLF
ncbi:hypothetical protein VHEMI01528 [[Torrubiella] hemipterigena]|uniref:Protein-S-isoprenylcysteine O-methyltransferase n=1 Tax=[Torrubiella] hemipterigena TaxID=1531966 RepID=A0A0A1T506_9HYPO|nr:hypothetical protein VHEMI01528 [[Torrubiella] hemipterigena]